MDTSIVTVKANTQSAIIAINTTEKAIASLATVSPITGAEEVKIYTWWPIIGQWLPMLSANMTPAKLPVQRNLSSIFVPSLDLRGETQIMIEFPQVQLNDVVFEVKFCYL